jgi:hypothetical protein
MYNKAIKKKLEAIKMKKTADRVSVVQKISKAMKNFKLVPSVFLYWFFIKTRTGIFFF